MKRQPAEWEKIFANDTTSNGLISKIHKQLLLNIKKSLIKKVGGRPERTFFQRRSADGQQAHEKMLNTASHSGMQIKTTMRYHLTPVRWLS